MTIEYLRIWLTITCVCYSTAGLAVTLWVRKRINRLESDLSAIVEAIRAELRRQEAVRRQEPPPPRVGEVGL